jgi:nucleotide-binding universal stress UspA family protein
MHKFRILVPVSFGSQSNRALKQAKSIALQVNAMVTCLHVIDNQGISGNLISREKAHKIRLESELKLASKVDAILAGPDAVLYELIVTSGKVYRKILDKASELDMDMIVMGRSDAFEGKKPQLGSNAAKVIERSTIPVLIIENTQHPSCRNLLVPLDLSAQVSLQLAKTIELAEKFNAMVTVVTILHPGGSRLEAAYRNRLFEIKKLFAQYDIFCRVKLISSDRKVADQLLSCSLRYHPDLVVLMTQEESDIADLAIGSVAKELICKSEYPVLTMTPVVQHGIYPFKSLFGSINNPIDRYDLNDHLIMSN